jgi:hypothetical protein
MVDRSLRAAAGATMAFIDMLILSSSGVLFVIVWILLLRASLRGGCRTNACRRIARDSDQEEHKPSAG